MVPMMKFRIVYRWFPIDSSHFMLNSLTLDDMVHDTDEVPCFNDAH
jgi:hypothetical protein